MSMFERGVASGGSINVGIDLLYTNGAVGARAEEERTRGGGGGGAGGMHPCRVGEVGQATVTKQKKNTTGG